MAQHSYKYRISTASNAPLSFWADQDNAGPYAICQATIILATFGERVLHVGQNGSIDQRRAFEEAQLTWKTVCGILAFMENNRPDYATLVKTTAKLVRKIRAKWSTSLAVDSTAPPRLEREIDHQVRKALNLSDP